MSLALGHAKCICASFLCLGALLISLAAVRTLCEGPWITCGDFNTNRIMGERRGCNIISYIMSDFSWWIEKMELHDSHLNGGKFSWFRGINHPSTTRLDRFLYSMEWEEIFKKIRQTLLPRVLSDHCPILLESGKSQTLSLRISG